MPNVLYLYSMHTMSFSTILEFQHPVKQVLWNPRIDGRLMITLSPANAQSSISNENGFCYWEAALRPNALQEEEEENEEPNHGEKKILPKQCWDVEVCEIINVPSGTLFCLYLV